MKFKKNGGFTLVELIVVIAILAILAGVAVPAYSGYIQKAEKAADLQLLGAVNTAFGAAALENNVIIEDITSAKIEINEGKVGKIADLAMTNATMADVTFTPTSTYMAAEDLLKLNNSFANFFAGNEGATFKVITMLKFNPATGTFDGYTDEITSTKYGKGQIVYTQSDVENLKDSTFITSDTLGAEALLNKVNEVTNFAAGLTDSTVMQNIFDSQKFQLAAAQTLGLDPTDEDFGKQMQAKLDAMIDDLQKKNPTLTAQEAKDQIYANAAVLYAAQNTTQMDKSEFTELLTSGGASSIIAANLRNNGDTSLSQAAMAYGMYTAYAHAIGQPELVGKDTTPVSVLQKLDSDENFRIYLTSPQGQKDMDAYLSALEIVNGSAGDADAVSQLMVNGFNDPALLEILNGALAK